MRTSCHVTSAWAGTGVPGDAWRPQIIDDYPEGLEYDMLTAGDPRSVPQVPVDLLVRCLNEDVLTALLADPNYTPTDLVEYSNEAWPEVEEPLW